MIVAKFEKDLEFTASAFFRLVNKIASEEISFTGLSPSYAFLIVTVEDNPGIRISELSNILHLETSSVTRLIEKLESKKFILRDSSPGVSQVYLTETGKQMYDNITIGIDRYIGQLKSVLGKKLYKELNKSLINAMERIENIDLE
jgi:MarR family transcriptional regulator, organic hydroperoxide resistance regulator